jgi:hypothetical protein
VGICDFACPQQVRHLRGHPIEVMYIVQQPRTDLKKSKSFLVRLSRVERAETWKLEVTSEEWRRWEDLPVDVMNDQTKTRLWSG